jgi:hypothetical protein
MISAIWGTEPAGPITSKSLIKRKLREIAPSDRENGQAKE